MKMLVIITTIFLSTVFGHGHLDECESNGICESTFIIHDNELCCGENETLCEVFVDTEQRTCNEHCELFGTFCVESWNELSDTCGHGAVSNCSSSRDDQICLCSKPPVVTPAPTPAPPPPPCSECPDHERWPKCYPCKGEVSELKLQYFGDKEGSIFVTQMNSDGGLIVLENLDLFSKYDYLDMWGSNSQRTFGKKIKIEINGCLDQYVYTDCDRVISIGSRIGDWLVISGESKSGDCEGGLDHPDCDCGNKLSCPHHYDNECY